MRKMMGLRFGYLPGVEILTFLKLIWFGESWVLKLIALAVAIAGKVRGVDLMNFIT